MVAKLTLKIRKRSKELCPKNLLQQKDIGNREDIIEGFCVKRVFIAFFKVRKSLQTCQVFDAPYVLCVNVNPCFRAFFPKG